MAHYFSEDQDSPLRIENMTVRLKGMTFELFTGSGVFSKDKLDRGTEVFIENMLIEDGWRVLDIGCAIGTVGIYVGKRWPSTKVVMTDVNKRAVMLAKKNVRRHGLLNQVKRSNLFENVEGKFNAILSNPPQHAGKDVCFEIIHKAPEFLEKRGVLQLVARHNKGGATFEKEMEKTFGNVETLAKKSGYRVYLSRKD